MDQLLWAMEEARLTNSNMYKGSLHDTANVQDHYTQWLERAYVGRVFFVGDIPTAPLSSGKVWVHSPELARDGSTVQL
jgi:hypothetical protein